MNLLVGGTLIASITMAWGYIKFIFSRIINLFIGKITVSDQIVESLSIYLRENFKISKFQPLSYHSTFCFVKPLNKFQHVIYEQFDFNDKIIFYSGLKILLVENIKKDDNKPSIHISKNIYFLRQFIDIEKLLIDSVNHYNKRYEETVKFERFYIKRIFGMFGKKISDIPEDGAASKGNYNDLYLGDKNFIQYNINDIGETNNKNQKINNIALPDEILQHVEELEKWKNHKQWYLDKNIPWKRGWLLYGKPGCGKTSLVRAIAEKLDLPIYIFEISTMTNIDLFKEWRNMLNCTPCIALIEDIDSVFNKRVNIRSTKSDNDSLTFDCLLNCIDGVENSDGLLTIITTNRIEYLDAAIGIIDKNKTSSSRPGRIDRIIELKELDEKCRRKIANRILIDHPNFIDEIIKKGEGDTGAQFQERCIQIALKHFWNEI